MTAIYPTKAFEVKRVTLNSVIVEIEGEEQFIAWEDLKLAANDNSDEQVAAVYKAILCKGIELSKGLYWVTYGGTGNLWSVVVRYASGETAPRLTAFASRHFDLQYVKSQKEAEAVAEQVAKFLTEDRPSYEATFAVRRQD